MEIEIVEARDRARPDAEGQGYVAIIEVEGARHEAWGESPEAATRNLKHKAAQTMSTWGTVYWKVDSLLREIKNEELAYTP